jgi:hypothetical protein
MSEQDERDEQAGAQDEPSESKDKLPFLPSGDDDTPLGDTDQHSDAPPEPAQP